MSVSCDPGLFLVCEPVCPLLALCFTRESVPPAALLIGEIFPSRLGGSGHRFPLRSRMPGRSYRKALQQSSANPRYTAVPTRKGSEVSFPGRHHVGHRPALPSPKYLHSPSPREASSSAPSRAPQGQAGPGNTRQCQAGPGSYGLAALTSDTQTFRSTGSWSQTH